ncbi:TonB-dependent receptor [Sphingomonas sp.]|uniref:TonB-dependent receptor n=1 Tax=Sphingomonas sp. TaxID=28214 RepID=UPI003CC6DA63
MTHRTAALRLALLGGTALAFAPPAYAQMAQGAAQTSTAPVPVGTPDDAPAQSAQSDIIVTATSVARRALDTPLAVTSLDAQQLQRTSAINQADILNTIPTIKADGGGGEVAANVFVRGLPSGGQYQFTPLEYDGIPVLSSFGLNSSAYDVYYRNDLGIDRLEFVRGGVSNLFGPGSVAGLINYISRTGGDELRGTAQVEVAERGRYRGDLAISGPLGNGFYFAVSGWYRHDDGPVRTGLPTKGYQVRGNLKYEWGGRNSITLSGQWIDDKDQYYLPIPLNGADRSRVRGNDGNLVYQVITPAAAGISYAVPGGTFTTHITDGVTAKGGQVALAFDTHFGDSGFGLNGRGKYSQYATRFGLWSDGDGLVNVPETQAAFLSNTTRRAAYVELAGATPANSTFTYAGTTTVLPANALLFANRFTDRYRPNHDYTGELNLTWNGGTGSIEHAVTLGGFYANAWARDFDVTTTYLAELNEEPRLVSLTANGTVISRGGVLNESPAGTYTNNYHQVERYAGYFADQMKIGDRFNFDIGARVEHLNGSIRRERNATTIPVVLAGQSTELNTVNYGTGGFLTGNVHTTEWAVAAGALYKLTDRVSLYVNGSRGYFFPEIRAVGFQPTTTAATVTVAPGTASYDGEIIKQVEGGIKVDQPWFNFTVSAFYTNLKNRRQVLFINNGLGGFTEAVNLVATRSWGMEGEFDLRLMRNLHFNGNLTLQNARYTQSQALVNNIPSPNTAVIGRDLERQPDFLYNAGLYYDDRTFDVSFFANYTGDNFTANTNQIRLNGWYVANLDAGVKLRVMGDRHVRVGVNVFNVFNEDAATEGSPRQDANQTVGGAYFVGRPVLPRRVTGRVSFNF